VKSPPSKSAQIRDFQRLLVKKDMARIAAISIVTALATLSGCANPNSSLPFTCQSVSDCDDGDPCTVDSCAGGGCSYSFLDGSTCPGTSVCTIGRCNGLGECVQQADVGKGCGEGNDCRHEGLCDSSGKCDSQPVELGTKCNDANSCTSADACDGEGACVGTQPKVGVPCNDNDACTVGEKCDDEGGCAGGAVVPLNQKDCELCSCDPLSGVSCVPIANVDCVCNLYGKVQVVDAFPDYEIQIVDAFPDLEVEEVQNFPDKPGRWQFVDAFPDFTIKYVDVFADIKIQFVDWPDGCN
jgi:hypothetical protein